MPIYEYQCEKCEHEFEREQRITDPPVKTCPKCRSRRVKKLISRTSFVLKGGGWYSDLYSSAKSGASGSDSAADSSGASGDGKSETKTETKTEAKSDAKSGSKKGSKSKPGKSAA
jgi:putative FmdB family regulatory protein